MNSLADLAWFIAVNFIIFVNFTGAIAIWTNQKLTDVFKMRGQMIFLCLTIFVVCLILHYHDFPNAE